MSLSVERFDARTWPEDDLATLFDDAFPPFITADVEAATYIDRVRGWFGDYAVMLVDTDRPVACGWGVPIGWSGAIEHLPSGYTNALERAVELHESRGIADTFVICGGIVSKSSGRRGTAAELIVALRDLPIVSSLVRVIAPVRPTMKPDYALTPIETYAAWQGDDGLPLDPWLRTHVRVGGRIIATAPQSQTMTGTVEQWESWTGLRFPSTGEYVIPRGLGTLHVDRDKDLGTYVEPNVWVQHR